MYKNLPINTIIVLVTSQLKLPTQYLVVLPQFCNSNMAYASNDTAKYTAAGEHNVRRRSKFMCIYYSTTIIKGYLQ